MSQSHNAQYQPRRGRPPIVASFNGNAQPGRIQRKRAKQLELFETMTASEFGGSLLGKSATSHAKLPRPLTTRQPIHLVMKSKAATGSRSMLAPENANFIRRLLHRLAKKYGVKVYRYANGGNHLHMLVTIHNADLFKHFLRAAAGLIARHVLRAERGRARELARKKDRERSDDQSLESTNEIERLNKCVREKRPNRTSRNVEITQRQSFWAQRPYTRIATWGREWRNIVNYFRLNNLEAIGFFKHQPRGRGSTGHRATMVTVPIAAK